MVVLRYLSKNPGRNDCIYKRKVIRELSTVTEAGNTGEVGGGEQSAVLYSVFTHPVYVHTCVCVVTRAATRSLSLSYSISLT